MKLASAALLRPVLTLSATLAMACQSHELSRLDPVPTVEVQRSVPAWTRPKLDLLFVIDDSGSMAEEQASLAANFDAFMAVLNNVDGGLPDVHIGVVSTNLGGNADGQCVGAGDAGRLINTPRVRSDCQGPRDPWIESLADDHGGRITNFDGTLTDTFACIAELGTQGCGFEQPLEAMKRALTNPANAGFVRKNAFLAVVFITDEDDCSATANGAAELFSSQACSDWLDPEACPLGLLDSFRCFEFGVECDPDEPRAVGEKSDCRPRAASPLVSSVDGYIDFLRNFKGNPRLVLTAGIIGPPGPVVVEPVTRSTGQGEIESVALAPSCVSGSGEAAPALRLSSFFDGFPVRSTVTTICDEDLTESLVLIAQLFWGHLIVACLDGDLVDTDPERDGVQPDCVVYDVRFPGTDDEVQGERIPSCEESGGQPTCYRIERDVAQCGGTPTELVFRIERGAEVPLGTEAQVRCVAN